MANIVQSKKRAKQALRNRSVNRGYKTKMKNALKIYSLNTDKTPSQQLKLISNYQKRIDQAAAKGVIKKNKASRLKSALMIQSQHARLILEAKQSSK